MQPIYLSIQQEETGAQIRKLMMKNGYTVRDVQGAMGFENPQAIYKMDIRQVFAESRQFPYIKPITACQYRRYPRR